MNKESNENIAINKHWTKLSLLTYAFPSIVMMFTISVYEIIDGFFISNYIDSTSFAAVNMVFPVLMILASFGMMIASGSSAIIAKKMGEKKSKVANRYFSMFVYFLIIGGIALSIIGIFIMKPVVVLLGAEGELLEIATYYGLMSLISMPAYILQTAFLTYYNTAGKPGMGLRTAIVSGLCIFTLDLILVGILGFGINGILIATIASEYISAIIPIVYFVNKKTKSLLHMVGIKEAFKNQNPSSVALILRSSLNGSSEAIQEIAASLVILLCMFQINRFIGEAGLVAYGIIDYAWIVFNSFYLGFSVAAAPLMSYQFGAQNKSEMRNLLKCGLIIIVIASIISFAVSEFLAPVIASIFVSYDAQLAEYSVYAFRIYAISFLFAGVSIYGSSLFTSLGDGLTSALIAFLRTIIFEAAALLILPEIIGSDGIWFAIGFAEVLATILTIIFICAKQKKFFKDIK